MQDQRDRYIISFKENNLKLGFNAYTIFLHFTFLPIIKLPVTTAEITRDFRQLPASNVMTSLVDNLIVYPIHQSGMQYKNVTFKIVDYSCTEMQIKKISTHKKIGMVTRPYLSMFIFAL
jgi:hypothetical protein